MQPSHTVSLNDGHTLPAIGFGTWTLTGEEATRVVHSALEVGYRLIDTAPRYENEREVGAAIRASGIARRELFVATKLRGADHGYRSTLAGLDRSLELLPEFSQPVLRAFDAARGILTQAWRPLGKGKAVQEPLVMEIARKHGKS